MKPRWTPGQGWTWIEGAYPAIEYDGHRFSGRYRKAQPNADGIEDGLVFLVLAKDLEANGGEELKCLRMDWINGAYECVGIVDHRGTP
jgi:hypothetical protein